MANDLWGTPQYIFDWLHEEFHFELDAAANHLNTKCKKFFAVTEDYPEGALAFNWAEFGKTIWLNPPYSNPLLWVKRAYEESLKGGCTVVCLLPADISTRWFHEWVIGKSEIRFIQGRIKFESPTTVNKKKYNSPKFGSMIAIYGPNIEPKAVSVKRPTIKLKR